jgi:hypothetical protein
LDVQVRHAGIKARGSSNEKREEKPRLTDSFLATAQLVFGKVKSVLCGHVFDCHRHRQGTWKQSPVGAYTLLWGFQINAQQVH